MKTRLTIDKSNSNSPLVHRRGSNTLRKSNMPIGTMQRLANDSAPVQRLQYLQELANTNAALVQREIFDEEKKEPGQFKAGDSKDPIQREEIEDEEPETGQFKSRGADEPVQVKSDTSGTHNGGLPSQLKAGIENLSGISMDGIKVHRNSAAPAKVGAYAYAQGRDIHLGPGQEKHLPHEAWHIVQQAQGRVKPTMQLKAGIAINDDAALEREADVMGARALQQKTIVRDCPQRNHFSANNQQFAMIQPKWDPGGKEGIEIWDTLIDGVRWYRNPQQQMWFVVEKEQGNQYNFWAGDNHKYSAAQWDAIEIDVRTPETEPGLGVLESIVNADLKTMKKLNIGNSRPKSVYLFTSNGANTGDKTSACYMVDTSMDDKEVQAFNDLRSMLIRTPMIFGKTKEKNYPIVQWLSDQSTIDAKMASIAVAIQKKLYPPEMHIKLNLAKPFEPQKWLITLADINTLIKLNYNSKDFQFMIDNTSGHIFIMDLERDNWPTFEQANSGLFEARALIEKRLSEA